MTIKKHLIAIAIAVHLLPALAADKDPLDYSLRQYGAVLAVAILGGLVSFYAKVKAGHVSALNLMHLIGELATSAFAGLLAFWLAEAAGLPQLLTICMVGISGHMGARAIALVEEWAQRRWSSGPPRPGDTP